MDVDTVNSTDLNFSINDHAINLNDIKDIRFTDRETDIIACIIAVRSSKKIAAILSISPKTVEIHIRNIMTRLNCNSRERIIDFIEKSDKLAQYKEHYSKLLFKLAFELELKKIAALIKAHNVNRNCLIFYYKQQTADVFINKLETQLVVAGLKVTSKAWELDKSITFFTNKPKTQQIDHIIYVVPNEFSTQSELTKPLLEEIAVLTLLVKQSTSPVILITSNDCVEFFTKNLTEATYITLEQHKDLCFLTLELLRSILPNVCIEQNITGLKEKYENPASCSFLEEKNTPTEFPKGKTKNNKSHKVLKKAAVFGLLFFLVSFVIFSMFQWKQIEKIKLQQKNERSASTDALQFNDFTEKNNREKQENPVIEKEQIKEWNLPTHVEYYVPRENITHAVWEKFNAPGKKTACLVGLKGLGGVGKTFLAIDSIRNSKQNYKFKGWFRADTKDLLNVDYFELGEKLRLFSQGMSDKTKINMVKNWLANRKDILLVYDNAPDMETLQYYLPDNGHVVVTSRNYKLPEAINVDVMTASEALKLLNKLIPNELQQAANYKQQARKLVDKLGYLPLAISQAGYYIHENMLKISDYLILYEANRKALLIKNSLPPRDQHEPVYITWDLNIKTIQNSPQGNKALDLLNFIACCDNENIPRKLLMQYLYKKNTGDTEILFNEILVLLRRYSLVNVFPDVVSIHNLVHHWVRDKYLKENKLSVLQRGKAAIEAIYTAENKAPEGIEFVKHLIPHANSIFLQIKPFVSDVELIDLMTILGNCYKTVGNYNKSKGFLKEALIINKKHLGASSVKTAKILSELGEIYRNLGNYIKAKDLLEKALIIIESHYGAHHIETAQILHKASSISLHLNNNVKYKKVFEKSLAIIEQHRFSNNKEIIKKLPKFSQTNVNVNDYVKTKQILEKVLKITENYYGNISINVIRVLCDLCWLHVYMGDHINAKQMSGKIFKTVQNFDASNHMEISWILHDLGAIHVQLHNYTKAKQILEKAITSIENYYGSDHVMMCNPLVNLGWVHLYLGDYDEAKKISKKALAIVDKNYGPNNINAIYAMHILSWIYIYSNDYKEAKFLCEKALTIINGLPSYNHSTLDDSTFIEQRHQNNL